MLSRGGVSRRVVKVLKRRAEQDDRAGVLLLRRRRQRATATVSVEGGSDLGVRPARHQVACTAATKDDSPQAQDPSRTAPPVCRLPTARARSLPGLRRSRSRVRRERPRRHRRADPSPTRAARSLSASVGRAPIVPTAPAGRRSRGGRPRRATAPGSPPRRREAAPDRGGRAARTRLRPQPLAAAPERPVRAVAGAVEDEGQRLDCSPRSARQAWGACARRRWTPTSSAARQRPWSPCTR